MVVCTLAYLVAQLRALAFQEYYMHCLDDVPTRVEHFELSESILYPSICWMQLFTIAVLHK